MSDFTLTYSLEIENAFAQDIPSIETFEHWLTAALSPHRTQGHVGLSLVSQDTMQTLNHTHRAKDKPTNVLSFPAHLPTQTNEGLPFLGDILLCWPYVCEEALEQGKSITAHTAHLLIHGALHLIGFDHEAECDAKIMEAHEISCLNSLGFQNPYQA